MNTDAVDAETPLNQAELQVLRAQYEKEGDMVGVQTKFNYAWVRPQSHNSLCLLYSRARFLSEHQIYMANIQKHLWVCVFI